jgi:hypothetical protein
LVPQEEGDRIAPALVVFAGPPCSGKSTLAALLALRLSIPHLAMDAVRQRILPGAAHTRADRRVAYRAMLLDAPYGHAEDRQDLALAGAGRVRLIECRVSPEIAVRRFHARGPDKVRLDLTAEIVERSAREYPYSGAGLTLDTGALSPGECLERVQAFVGSIPAG